MSLRPKKTVTRKTKTKKTPRSKHLIDRALEEERKARDAQEIGLKYARMGQGVRAKDMFTAARLHLKNAKKMSAEYYAAKEQEKEPKWLKPKKRG